jgi:hypothetical protein
MASEIIPSPALRCQTGSGTRYQRRVGRRLRQRSPRAAEQPRSRVYRFHRSGRLISGTDDCRVARDAAARRRASERPSCIRRTSARVTRLRLRPRSRKQGRVGRGAAPCLAGNARLWAAAPTDPHRAARRAHRSRSARRDCNRGQARASRRQPSSSPRRPGARKRWHESAIKAIVPSCDQARRRWLDVKPVIERAALPRCPRPGSRARRPHSPQLSTSSSRGSPAGLSSEG